MISVLIPFSKNDAEIGSKFEKGENSLLWTRDTIPTASNHLVNLSGHYTWPFNINKSDIEFIPYSVWAQEFVKVKILEFYEKTIKGHNYGQYMSNKAWKGIN